MGHNGPREYVRSGTLLAREDGSQMAQSRRHKRPFGSIRKLPSGRFQARYTGPDGRTYTARTELGRPLTFETRGDASTFLSLRESEIMRDAWRPSSEPRTPPVTLAAYADAWLGGRDLAQTTRDHYRQLLDDHVL